MSQYLKRADGGVDHYRIWSLILAATAPVIMALPMPDQWDNFQNALSAMVGIVATGIAQFASAPRDVRELCEMRKSAEESQAAAVGEA